jgi:hypothetical protein
MSNYFLVDTALIESQLLGVVNEFLDSIEYDKDKAIARFSNSRQVSFTSYGRDIISTLSLLIDASLATDDAKAKQNVDSVLTTYCMNLPLMPEQRLYLASIISTRYSAEYTAKTEIMVQRVIELLRNSPDPEIGEPADKRYYMEDMTELAKKSWTDEDIKLIASAPDSLKKEYEGRTDELLESLRECERKLGK